MTGWNFDMASAPRGETRVITRKIGKNEVEVQEHVPVTIFVAGADGTTVTPSRWLAKEGRWCMFTKDVPPIAWRPWPRHPGIGKGPEAFG
jgi:hypothetical protein